MLTPGDLTSLRAVGEAFLPDSAVISRPARTSDSAGGYTSAYSDVATVKARVQTYARQQPTENVIGERVQAKTAFTIVLPALTDVRPGDRITIGSVVYEVNASLAPRGYEVVRNVSTEVVG